MCTLLDISSIRYITGTMTRFYSALRMQVFYATHHELHSLEINRRTAANHTHALPDCDQSDMAAFFYNIYRRMFPRGFLRHDKALNVEYTLFLDKLPCYTPQSFALLIKFTMNRVYKG